MHSTFVSLDDKNLVGLDLDFGDTLRIDVADDSVVNICVKDDAALAKLITAAQALQSLRRARSMSCGHVECANNSGHIDFCFREDTDR